MSLFVNGQEISSKDIDAEKERLRQQHDQAFADMKEADREKQLSRWCKENVIERVLLQQAAEKKMPDVTDDNIEQAYKYLLTQNPEIQNADKDKVRADIKRQIQVENLMQKITAGIDEPTEEQIEKFYNDDIEQFTIPPTIRAAHIVFHPSKDVSVDEQKKKLAGILDDIKNGADFVETATKFSDCGDNGGDLGYFARGKMVPAFEDVVFDMEIGQVSDVFQTEFGVHIAKVLDKKPEMPCELQYAREMITNQLQQQSRETAITNFIDLQKEKAEIKDEA